MRPKRIQRKRTAGWKNTDNAIYVGRPTKWGNPFGLGQKVYREGIGYCEILSLKEAVDLFKKWIYADEQRAFRETVIKELKGHNLSCWCDENGPCHGDELLKLANSCDKSCGPSDFQKGGKCDLNGCYYE